MVASIQISISQNANCDNLVGFPKSGHSFINVYCKCLLYNGFCLRGPISVKHQFLCPAVISAIVISVN